MDIFHNYMGIFVVSFLVAIIITPFMRRLAIANGIVDRPVVARKAHRAPIAYLGGVGVYLAILAGILFAYTAPLHHMVTFHETKRELAHSLPGGVPIVVLLGMTVIMFCGLVDDVVGIDPRAKIAGMLFAAAALASQDVGVKVAAGVVIPIAHVLNIPVTTLPDGLETIAFQIPLPFSVLDYHAITFDVVYWIGTAVIAVFVLGACNASNLIDGLDGLASGVTATANVGLLIISPWARGDRRCRPAGHAPHRALPGGPRAPALASCRTTSTRPPFSSETPDRCCWATARSSSF